MGFRIKSKQIKDYYLKNITRGKYYCYIFK